MLTIDSVITMSSTCDVKEAMADVKNVDDVKDDGMDAKSQTQIVIGTKDSPIIDSGTTNEVKVSADNQTTVQPGSALENKHEPIDSEASGNKTESDSGHKVAESTLIATSVSNESTRLDTIDNITEKETLETDAFCNDDAKMIDSPLVTVIKKEPVETEMAADVPEIAKTDASEITEKSQALSDVVIKLEPIDYDDQPIMSRDGVEILKTENLMSYRQIKTEKDDHDSGTENDSGDDSSVVFSDAPVVASDDESEGLSKVFTPKEVPRTKGEMLPEDLPPLEELKINLAKDEKLLLMGQVSGIVNTLVVIQSLPDTPALNEDSVFFYEDRKVFGRVFEIFGPVANPFYSIRFNSIEDIKNKNVNMGDKVYCAPNLEEITQYIFLDQLKQMKGSDASWKDNNEPPERCLDYSDDESERRSKSKRKGDKEIKEEKEEEESYLDALPGATGQRSTKPTRRRRQNKKPQNDRDRPAPDSFPPSNNNQNMWNCWPPRGPCPRFTPPSNQMNFRQPPQSAPWHQSQQGPSVHPWQQQQPSMNPRHFNPQHNFHYQNLPHMNRMPFGNGNPNHQGNPNLFMNNVPNTGVMSAQNNRFAYSQNQNNYNSGPNRNNSFQPVSNVGNAAFENPAHSGFSQNSSAPQIMDTRFIQNNQPSNTPIYNPYHTGAPQ